MASDNFTDYIDKKYLGGFNSFVHYMNEVPEIKWQQQFKLFEQQYGILVKRLTLNELKIDKKYLTIRKQGKGIAINSNLPTAVYYKNIIKTNSVLMIKMHSDLDSDDIFVDNFELVLIIIFVVLLTIGLYLWMRPIWRDLKILKVVTTNFGGGDFKSRSTLTKKSAIWQLSNTFNKMATRISKLITSHKDLTRAVSHELRTPLARLRFAIDMLNEETDEALKQNFIDNMGIDVDELELLISELLSYAKFERENPDIKYTELEILPWLVKLIEIINFDQNNINLQLVNSNNQSVLLEFDPKLIDRALNNLIRNAIRYANNRVDVRLSVVDDFCCFSIDDDGPGIPENERERILQPFTRIDSSRNRKTGGYGLGLSIVQQIVKWHNGKLYISTSRYNGATFEMMLPRKHSPAEHTK